MSKKDDAERLREDVLHCFSKVAQHRLDGKENPDFLLENEIKINGTSRKKTLRLLREHGYLGRLKEIESIYVHHTSYVHKHWEILKFDAESETFASKGSFNTTWQELYKEIFSNAHYYQKDTFYTVGYISNNDLSDSARLDIFWHPDDYDRQESKRYGDKTVYFYPKAFMRQRAISALRCLIEHKFNEQFNMELEKRVGMPEDSLFGDREIHTTLRNPFYTPYHFNMDSFEGSKGFLAELDHQVAYFKALRQRVQKFTDLAKKTGGFDELIRQFRKALITELFEEAPLNAFSDVEKDSDGDMYGIEAMSMLGAQYILKNPDLFDYDTLYASGEEAAYINGRHVSMDSPYEKFEPNEQQARLIDTESTVEPTKVPSSSVS